MHDELSRFDPPAHRRPGLLGGVCRWLADRIGLVAFWVRLAVLVTAWLSGWWPAAAIYLAAAILLGQARPARLPRPAEWRLPRGFTSFDAADLGGRCRRLERRLREVETRLRRERNWDELLRRPV
jgi:phage shock protein PspC (stress-responsive transcriptional regulator)